jgi:hypothetical protein
MKGRMYLLILLVVQHSFAVVYCQPQRDIPSANLKKGLLNVYAIDDHYYFDIPDAVLGRDMLLVTRGFKRRCHCRYLCR